jgi:hypothetical protein
MVCKESFIDPDKDENFNRNIDEFMVRVNKATEKYTCVDCPVVADCPYRWDPYNTNGDCLAMK